MEGLPYVGGITLCRSKSAAHLVFGVERGLGEGMKGAVGGVATGTDGDPGLLEFQGREVATDCEELAAQADHVLGDAWTFEKLPRAGGL